MSVLAIVEVARVGLVCCWCLTTLHHLLLQVAALLIHHVATLTAVLDEAEAERTTTVLVACELGDGGLGVRLRAKLDNACTCRATVWLVLDLGALDLPDGGEELDKVLVAGAPWKLESVSISSCDIARSVYLRCGRR